MQFFYVKLINSLFYLLLFSKPLTVRSRTKSIIFQCILLSFFSAVASKRRALTPAICQFFQPMPLKSSSCFGMFLDKGGAAPLVPFLQSTILYDKLRVVSVEQQCMINTYEKKRQKKTHEIIICSRTIQKQFEWVQRIFFSHMKIARKEYPLHHPNPVFVPGFEKTCMHRN